jgi:hypothetical protein
VTDDPSDFDFQDNRFIAAVDMLGRTGISDFQIRYCDEDQPTVWIAVAHWPERVVDGEVVIVEHWDACGGPTPWRAVFRLCEASIDGGHCRHCGRPTSVDDSPADALLDSFSELICWYRFDPELETFRRSCEGVAP